MLLLNALRQKKIGIMVVLLLIGVSIYYLLFIFESSEVKAEKKAVAQYLKEKYGQDFVIKKVGYHWPYLGAAKQIRTYVVSKDETPIAFFLKRRAGHPEDYFAESHLFFEDEEDYKSYLDLKWEQETALRFQNIAKIVFSRPVLLRTSLKITHAYKNQIFGTTPLYFETLKTTSEMFTDKKTSQAIYLIHFYDIDQGDRLQEADKIYSFMNELKQLGIKNYRMGLVYFAPEYETEMRKIIDKIGFEATIEAAYGHLRPRDYMENGKKLRNIRIIQEDIENINNSTDLLKYLKNK